jgi:hypothetical protein
MKRSQGRLYILLASNLARLTQSMKNHRQLGDAFSIGFAFHFQVASQVIKSYPKVAVEFHSVTAQLPIRRSSLASGRTIRVVLTVANEIPTVCDCLSGTQAAPTTGRRLGVWRES